MNGLAYQANLDLLQGTLDLFVLKTLSWGRAHGNSVVSVDLGQTQDSTGVERVNLDISACPQGVRGRAPAILATSTCR